jgi:hypothetical protein
MAAEPGDFVNSDGHHLGCSGHWIDPANFGALLGCADLGRDRERVEAAEMNVSVQGFSETIPAGASSSRMFRAWSFWPTPAQTW